ARPMTKPLTSKALAGASKFPTREAWLQFVGDRMAPWFAELGHPLPPWRASIGWTSRGSRSKTIGQCWSHHCSTDSVHEIFLVPQLSAELTRIAGVLAHELIHAAVGLEAKHGKVFKRVALGIGLEGKMTATTEGPEFLERVKSILDAAGPFPTGHM